MDFALWEPAKQIETRKSCYALECKKYRLFYCVITFLSIDYFEQAHNGFPVKVKVKSYDCDPIPTAIKVFWLFVYYFIFIK